MLRRLIFWLVIIGLGVYLYRHWPFGTLPWAAPPDEAPVTVDIHQVVLEQVEGMGRLELVRYRFTDVVEQRLSRRWLVPTPDATALVLVSGEAVGCVDLARIDSQDVFVQGDTMIVTLPPPEICYYKIDHERSRVVDVDYAIGDEASTLVDEAYRRAEREIFNSALRGQILEQTQQNAERALRPLLQAASGGKSVFIKFDPPPATVRPQR